MDTFTHVQCISRIRLGRVLTPEEVQREAASLVQLPKIDGYGIYATVPNWLILEFERPQCQGKQKFDVLTSKGGAELAAILTLQSRSIQLRVLMLMNDEQTQRYLVDSIHRGRFCMLFEPENTRQLSAMTLSTQYIDTEYIGRLIRDASNSTWNAQEVVQLGQMYADVPSVPSLIDDQPVTDVITVVVVGDELKQALRSQAKDVGEDVGEDVPLEQTMH